MSYDLFIPQLKVSKNGLETFGLPTNGFLYLPPNGETIVNSKDYNLWEKKNCTLNSIFYFAYVQHFSLFGLNKTNSSSANMFAGFAFNSSLPECSGLF